MFISLSFRYTYYLDVGGMLQLTQNMRGLMGMSTYRRFGHELASGIVGTWEYVSLSLYIYIYILNFPQ